MLLQHIDGPKFSVTDLDLRQYSPADLDTIVLSSEFMDKVHNLSTEDFQQSLSNKLKTNIDNIQGNEVSVSKQWDTSFNAAKAFKRLVEETAEPSERLVQLLKTRLLVRLLTCHRQLMPLVTLQT